MIKQSNTMHKVVHKWWPRIQALRGRVQANAIFIEITSTLDKFPAISKLLEEYMYKRTPYILRHSTGLPRWEAAFSWLSETKIETME